MYIKRNVRSIPIIILNIGLLVGVGIMLFFSIESPIFYLHAGIFLIVFLITAHKSATIKLLEEKLIYRKYFIRRVLKYTSINAILITKYSFDHRYGSIDLHDKNKNLRGYIFLLKNEEESFPYHFDSIAVQHTDWSNIHIDAEYQVSIIKKILLGGYNGKIFIATSLKTSVGKEIEGLLRELKYNFDKLIFF